MCSAVKATIMMYALMLVVKHAQVCEQERLTLPFNSPFLSFFLSFFLSHTPTPFTN
jgi:hypothetical protein